MWLKAILLTLLALVVAVVVVIFYGAARWQGRTKGLHAKLQAARAQSVITAYDAAELEGLPAPVRRYFQAVLRHGQRLVSAVHVEHAGSFNASASGEEWRPFTSRQRVIMRRPGFVWDARIRMAAGISVYVHDAYVAGEGVLTARLLGLLTVMEQPSTPQLAHGELMRFLAEAAWYPTALLPVQGIRWEAIDETSARASLTDGSTKVSLVFHFDEAGLIGSVCSSGRYRLVNGEQTASEWQGRFWDYELRAGMLVPLAGEVAWLLEGGAQPYWRGRIQRIEYEYAR